MLALAALLFSAAHIGAAQPPAAFVDSGAKHVRLGITSWCWDARCGAPLGATGQRVIAARGAPVRVVLKLEPLDSRVSVGGSHEKATTHGDEISWDATRAGGLTVYVKYRRGWVIYSARLEVR